MSGRQILNREQFEAHYSDSAMTSGAHAAAEAERGRPVTSEAIGETGRFDYDATPARRQANIIFEGQERPVGASRAWGSNS
jgi:hypothetical protein